MPTGDQADVCNSCLLPYNNKERTPKVRVTVREDSYQICYLLLSDLEVLSHVLQELSGTVHVPRQCHNMSGMRTNYTGREVRISWRNVTVRNDFPTNTFSSIVLLIEHLICIYKDWKKGGYQLRMCLYCLSFRCFS